MDSLAVLNSSLNRDLSIAPFCTALEVHTHKQVFTYPKAHSVGWRPSVAGGSRLTYPGCAAAIRSSVPLPTRTHTAHRHSLQTTCALHPTKTHGIYSHCQSRPHPVKSGFRMSWINDMSLCECEDLHVWMVFSTIWSSVRLIIELCTPHYRALCSSL